jgi:hypothetical protein
VIIVSPCACLKKQFPIQELLIVSKYFSLASSFLSVQRNGGRKKNSSLAALSPPFHPWITIWMKIARFSQNRIKSVYTGFFGSLKPVGYNLIFFKKKITKTEQ